MSDVALAVGPRVRSALLNDKPKSSTINAMVRCTSFAVEGSLAMGVTSSRRCA